MVKLAEKALADSCGLFFPKLKLIKRLVYKAKKHYNTADYVVHPKIFDT